MGKYTQKFYLVKFSVPNWNEISKEIFKIWLFRPLSMAQRVQLLFEAGFCLNILGMQSLLELVLL